MIFALLAIWIFFSAVTDGIFFEARNLSNLFRQTAVISFLAVGMVFIIISGHIDLSVGSIAGLTGAVAAMMQVKWLGPWLFARFPDSQVSEISFYISIAAILSALLLGALIGLFQGFWTAYQNVPSFIVTLAGMLIFRGAILGITDGITISPMETFFRDIGQAYVPASAGWAISLTASVLCAFLMWNKRRKTISYGLPAGPLWTFGLAVSSSALGIIIFTAVMNKYCGIPAPVIILLAVSALMIFLSNNTTFGRYIYAIGGNKEAARLSGIDIPKILLWNFAIMGALSAAGGIVLTARLDAATANAGSMFELSAIAACVIGGCSLSGGRGSITGALIGALVMASLDNGMSLMNVQIFWQQIIKGLVLLSAVWVDSRNTKG